jgi:hypothetical protein
MAWRGRLDGRPSEPRMADGRMWEQYTGPWEAAPARASKGLRPPRARPGCSAPDCPGRYPPKVLVAGHKRVQAGVTPVWRPGSHQCRDPCRYGRNGEAKARQLIQRGLVDVNHEAVDINH